MGARDLVSRTLRTVLRAVEGAYRPGPYFINYGGMDGAGWLPDGAPTNWWQTGGRLLPGYRTAMVEACVSAYAQTTAMCPGNHWRLNSKEGRDRVTNSALSRILRKPNEYQTISDFMMNLVRQLYLDGNAYALALRNDRFEVSEIHIFDSRMCLPQLAVTGDVFYHLRGNAVIERQLEKGTHLIVPQRDVLHVRLAADRRYPYPLMGESPLIATMSDIATSDAIAAQQIDFYRNQARPSAVLSTDLQLNKDQVQFLRDRWDEQSRGLNQGKTPILTSGLKVQPWSVGGRDAQIAEMMKISENHIALAFRIPLQLLGLAGGTGGSTEALIQLWLSTGLGFCLNHVEQSFDQLFQLKGEPDDYTEFDTSALLRSLFRDRIEGLARAVQGGILSPNEARNTEGYGDVPYGDSPRVQQQVVPLEAAAGIMPGAAGGTGPHPPPAGGPNAAPAAAAQPAPQIPKPPTKDYHDDVQREIKRVLDTVERIGSERVRRTLN